MLWNIEAESTFFGFNPWNASCLVLLYEFLKCFTQCVLSFVILVIFLVPKSLLSRIPCQFFEKKSNVYTFIQSHLFSWWAVKLQSYSFGHTVGTCMQKHLNLLHMAFSEICEKEVFFCLCCISCSVFFFYSDCVGWFFFHFILCETYFFQLYR